jgi:hypothetical protein
MAEHFEITDNKSIMREYIAMLHMTAIYQCTLRDYKEVRQILLICSFTHSLTLLRRWQPGVALLTRFSLTQHPISFISNPLGGEAGWWHRDQLPLPPSYRSDRCLLVTS